MTDDIEKILRLVSELNVLITSAGGHIQAKPVAPGTRRDRSVINIKIENVNLNLDSVHKLLVDSGNNAMTNINKTFTNTGQAASIGDHNTVDNTTLIQAAPKEDLTLLANQLAEIRKAMLGTNPSPDDLDAAAEIGAVAQAEKAAKKGDRSKVMDALEGAGKWTLEVAKSVAAGLVKDAIEGKIGSN